MEPSSRPRCRLERRSEDGLQSVYGGDGDARRTGAQRIELETVQRQDEQVELGAGGGRGPFELLRPHWATLIVAIGFVLAVLGAGAAGSHDHGAHKQGKVEPYETLFDVEDGEVLAAASEYLRNSDWEEWPLGGPLNPDTTLNGATQLVDHKLIKKLEAEHSREEIIAFARAGAPLVRWKIAYFRPFEYAGRQEVVRVVVGLDGRIIAANYNYRSEGETRERPSDAWVEEQRQRIAAGLRVDPEQLLPLELPEFEGSSLANYDALWRVEGVELGEFVLVAGAFRFPTTEGFGARVVRIGEPPEPTYWGVGAFVAAGLAVLLAFILGRGRAGGDPRSSDRLLLVGFGVGVALVLGQLGLMATGKTINVPALVLFFVVAIGLSVTGVVFARALRRGSLQPPSRGVGIALVVLAAAAFIASILMCGGTLTRGCCERCGILRTSVAPVVLIALAMARSRPQFGGDVVLLAVALLTPHCICDNLVGHHWIMRVGASPMCFFLFYGAILVALTGLRGVFARASLAVGVLALAVTGGLAYSHHVYHFPW